MRIFAHVEPGLSHLNRDDESRVVEDLLHLGQDNQILTTDRVLSDVLLERGREQRSITLFTNVSENERANVLPGQRIINVRCKCNMADIRAFEGAHRVMMFYGGHEIVSKFKVHGRPMTHPIFSPLSARHELDSQPWDLFLIDWSDTSILALWKAMGWTNEPRFVVGNGTTNLAVLPNSGLITSVL